MKRVKNEIIDNFNNHYNIKGWDNNKVSELIDKIEEIEKEYMIAQKKEKDKIKNSKVIFMGYNETSFWKGDFDYTKAGNQHLILSKDDFSPLSIKKTDNTDNNLDIKTFEYMDDTKREQYLFTDDEVKQVYQQLIKDNPLLKYIDKDLVLPTMYAEDFFNLPKEELE